MKSWAILLLIYVGLPILAVAGWALWWWIGAKMFGVGCG